MFLWLEPMSQCLYTCIACTVAIATAPARARGKWQYQCGRLAYTDLQHPRGGNCARLNF